MEFKYQASPVIRRPLNTNRIMIRLGIGLLIVYAFGLYNASKISNAYLINAILLLVVSLAVATITEVVFALALKKKPIEFIKKSFYYITCIILVLTVPANTSLYAMGVATFIAIFFGKLVFGGFGQNVFNPAGVGRAIIATSFAGKVSVDAITSATVTTRFASMNWTLDLNNYTSFINDLGGLKAILMGSVTGAIGEIFLVVIIVGIFLAIFDVIDWRIPFTYIGLIFLAGLIIGLCNGAGIGYALAFVASGGVGFGGVFMLTDPVTNPQTRPGKILFAAIAALLTILIRFYGNLPEGVVFSILLVNLLSPAIDLLFVSKQIVSRKRNISIVFGSIVLILIIMLVIGNTMEKGVYTPLNNETVMREVSE